MVKIVRVRQTDAGTEGMLFASDFACYTFELPWRQNKSNISCIPTGTYNVEMKLSPKFGFTYWVKSVENRNTILIHSGNYAGDVHKNLKSHTNGCLILGSKFGLLENQRAILNSRITVRKFINYMESKPFVLEISRVMPLPDPPAELNIKR